MNKASKFMIEGTIIASTMVASNEIMAYYVPPYKKVGATTRFMCGIASSSVGYFIGRKVSKFIVGSIDQMITAYKAEVNNG